MPLSDDEIGEIAQQLVLNRIEDLLEGSEISDYATGEDGVRVANAIESIRDMLADQFAERR